MTNALDSACAPLLLLLCALTSGCFSFARTPPNTRRFVLDPARAAAPAEAAVNIRLDVRQFHAAAAYAGRKFVHRIAPAEIETDFYHEWFVAPAIAITQAARNWLAQSHSFAAVHSAGQAVAADWTIDGDILTFYGDYREEPAAVLEMHVTVVDVRTRDLVHQKRYERREGLSDHTPEALVEGFRQAVAGVLAEIEGDLVRAAGH